MTDMTFRVHTDIPPWSRRTFLGALALVPVAACADPTGPSEPSVDAPAAADAIYGQLEQRYDARIGVFAMDTGTGASIAHRADERFAFCSTHKVITAAAVLAEFTSSALDSRVDYTAADLVTYSPITEQNIGSGMTIGALCDAAIRFSDNTAANLLVREIGGPAAVTRFARSLGDEVSNFDRVETELNSAVPGDARDTSSPRAFASLYRSIVLGDVLDAESRGAITDSMLGNTTGDRQIRAGVPSDWRVVDKTGSGSYGTGNDVAIVWPPSRSPIMLAIMTSRGSQTDEPDPGSIADATRAVVDSI